MEGRQKEIHVSDGSCKIYHIKDLKLQWNCTNFVYFNDDSLIVHLKKQDFFVRKK